MATTVKKTASKAKKAVKDSKKTLAKTAKSVKKTVKSKVKDMERGIKKTSASTNGRYSASENGNPVGMKEVKESINALWHTIAKATKTKVFTVSQSLERKFINSVKSIDESDVNYVLSKAGEKAKEMMNSAKDKAVNIGKQMMLLYQMLQDSVNKKFKVPWGTIAAITATLLYFLSPIDLIPDFVPGVGLVDDAMVIGLCLWVIRKDLRRYAEEFKIKLSEYGL